MNEYIVHIRTTVSPHYHFNDIFYAKDAREALEQFTHKYSTDRFQYTESYEFFIADTLTEEFFYFSAIRDNENFVSIKQLKQETDRRKTAA